MRVGFIGWVVGIVVVCTAIAALVTSVDRLMSPSAPTPSHQVSAAKTKPSIRQSARPVATPVATPRDQHMEATKLLAEAKLASENALDEIVTWNNEILPMLEQSEGENIAVDDDLVEKLSYVIEQKRKTQDELEVGLSQIELLIKQVNSLSAKDEPELLSVREISQIRVLHSDAKSAFNSWNKAVKRGIAIVRRSQREPNLPTQSNLQNRLDESADEKILADLEEEQVNGPPEEELQDVAMGDLFEGDVNSAIRDGALSADVKTTLAPFLKSRDIQPRLSGAAIRLENTMNFAPMSLSRLSSMGALNESLEGLKRLAAIAGDRKLSEPKWHIHSMPNNWSEADMEFLKKAQLMLRDYGAELVKQGHLSN